MAAASVGAKRWLHATRGESETSVDAEAPLAPQRSNACFLDMQSIYEAIDRLKADVQQLPVAALK